MNLVRASRSGGVEFCTATGQEGRWRGSRGANTGSLTRATERRRLGHDRPPNTWPQDKALSNIKSSSTDPKRIESQRVQIKFPRRSTTMRIKLNYIAPWFPIRAGVPRIEPRRSRHHERPTGPAVLIHNVPTSGPPSKLQPSARLWPVGDVAELIQDIRR